MGDLEDCPINSGWQPVATPNDLRIDVAAGANGEARFNLPPHQSELN